MNRFDGRVALITGAARGQGRSHAVHLAREGADVVLCDIGHDVATARYPMGTRRELDETRDLVEAEGRRAYAAVVDVRDIDGLRNLVEEGIAELGKIDIAIANACIGTFALAHEMSTEMWQDMVDIGLTGVWNTFRAVLPHMRERRYGRLIATGSNASVVGMANLCHYVAVKHGVLGLTKTLAIENAEFGITAVCVCPTHVGTPMLLNDAFDALVTPDDPSRDNTLDVMRQLNTIPVAYLDPADVSKTVLHLASDDAAFISGSAVMVDAAFTAR